MSIAYDIAVQVMRPGKSPKNAKKGGFYVDCPNCGGEWKGFIIDGKGKSSVPGVHCHKNCNKDEIIDAYKRRNLWPKFGKQGKEKGLQFYGYWVYLDQNRKNVLKVVRYDKPEGGKVFIPHLWDDVSESWVKSTESKKNMPQLLYKLPEVIEAAKKGEPIFDVEGEKKVDILFENKLTATTINGGCGNMNNWYGAKPEKWCNGSKLIVVIADHDLPGVRAAIAKARHYYKHGFTVKFLTIKDFGEIRQKGGPDIYDWFQTPDASREKLIEMVSDLPDWKPEDGDEEFADLFDEVDKLPENSNVVSITNPDEIVISPFCELATANEFIEDHREDALFVEEQTKWYVWNGKRWEPDSSTMTKVRKLMTRTIKKFYAKLNQQPGMDRDKLAQWFKSALGKTWITHALYMAQPEMTFEYTGFNADPFILNCNNGMVDLKTGELLPHDKQKYCNLVTAHDYPGLEGHSDAWQSSLLYAFGNNVALHDYVQTLAGYAATGLAQEKKFFLFWGPQGDNLKSTIADGIKYALGPYAGSIDKRLIIQVANENKYCDSSQLLGLRFGVMDEIYRRDKIDDGKFRKIFSGGDALRGSFVFKDTFDFDSQCTVIAFGNEKPHLDSGNNQASWNRVVVVPFKNKLPDGKVDRSFRDKLKQDASAILSWVVQGTLRYLHNIEETGDGLKEPSAVLEAIKEYKEEMDNIKDYLSESIADDPIGSETLTDFYSDYAGWTKKSGFHAVSKKRFVAEVAAHGHVQNKDGAYYGIRLIKTPKSRYAG